MMSRFLALFQTASQIHLSVDRAQHGHSFVRVFKLIHNLESFQENWLFVLELTFGHLDYSLPAFLGYKPNHIQLKRCFEINLFFYLRLVRYNFFSFQLGFSLEVSLLSFSLIYFFIIVLLDSSSDSCGKPLA
jgi:hypothetical protein